MENIIILIQNNAETIIALLAFILSIYTCMSQRKFNKDSVRPYCNINHDFNGEIYSLSIENAGSGPLIIHDLHYITENGSSYKMASLLNMQNFSSDDFTVDENVLNKKAISPNTEKVFFSLQFCKKMNRTEIEELLSATDDITLYVKYGDIYSDTFDSSFNKSFRTILRSLKDENDRYRITIASKEEVMVGSD